MGDDLAQADQEEGKFKGLNRLRGKLSVFKRHSSSRGNEGDVDDFLRPSSISPEPSGPLVPRLDTNAARGPAGGPPPVQFYPGHLRAEIADRDYPFEKYQPHKPQRRLDLAVGFTRQEPEFIGEGGEEAEDAPIIVGQRRHIASRGVSRSNGLPSDNGPQGPSVDIPIIRKPLRRALTGLEELGTVQNDSRPPSGSSLENAISAAKDNHDDYPSPSEFSRNENLGRMAADLQGYSDNRRKRTSQAYGVQPRLSENALSRSQTLPYKGLRRMQADEGLAHRNTVRNSMQRPPNEGHRPSSSRSNVVVSPPARSPHQQTEYETERNSSRQSRRSLSPQPYTSYSISQPPTAEKEHSLQYRPRTIETETAQAPRYGSNDPYHVQLSVSENLDALPLPYHEVPPLSSHHATLKDRILVPSDQQPHRARALSSSYNAIPKIEKQQQPNPNADAAMQEFADRVSGTFAIFDLADEKETADVSKLAWLRVAIWWFLKGRTELHSVRSGGKSTQWDRGPGQFDGGNAVSMQSYVDLAKAWWIIMKVTMQQDCSPAVQDSKAREQRFENFDYVQGVLMHALNALAASLQKRGMMPPHQMMIQGMDTRIWLPPTSRQFPPQWMWTLGGKIFQSPDDPPLTVDPLSALPIGDTESTAYLGRAFAEANVMHGEELPQHGSFPCLVSVVQDKSTRELRLVISSQNTAIYVVVQDGSAYGIRWEHIRWDDHERMLRVKLPNKLRLRIYCSRPDYAFLRAQGRASQPASSQPTSGPPKPKIFEPRHDEITLQTYQLSMFQYNDTSEPAAFPRGRQYSAKVAVFERLASAPDDADKRTHYGYRISFVMADSSKPSVNLVLDGTTLLEYAFDPTHADMQLRINEIDRCRRALVGFESLQDREMFRDFVSGTVLGPKDHVKLKLPSQGTTVSLPSAATQSSNVTLHWGAIQVLESLEAHPEDIASKRISSKPSQDRRIMMYDKIGSILTRLSSAVGALRIRVEANVPVALKVLHSPHTHYSTVTAGPDLNGVDTMHGVFDLMNKADAEVVQSYVFANVRDLHSFQQAITAYRVVFDGVAAHFSIPRRRMYVPITQTWGTTGARVQIVQREGFFRLLAFFEGYELADSLNFQVKSSDAFEKLEVKASKGHGEERKPTPGGYGVKLVDAKFLLPGSGKDDEDERNGVNVVREVGARFVSLDADDYAMEHEDITIAFETEQGELHRQDQRPALGKDKS